MTAKLPKLPSAVRALTDEEDRRLNEIMPGLPKSLRDCPTCSGDKTFRWYLDYRNNDFTIVDYECSCADQIRLFKFFHNAGLGHSYQVLSWADLGDELYDKNVEALSAITDYWENPKAYVSRGFGLMLYGSNGTGKTLLSSLLLKSLLTHGNGVNGYFTTFTNLIDRYAAGWGGHRDLAEWFERKITYAQVLVIDDVGKEYAGRLGVSSNALDMVVRARTQHDLPTIFTTNLNPSEFRTTYSGSTWSLLAEKVLPYEIKGVYGNANVGYRDKQLEITRKELQNRLIRPIVWC